MAKKQLSISDSNLEVCSIFQFYEHLLFFNVCRVYDKKEQFSGQDIFCKRTGEVNLQGKTKPQPQCISFWKTLNHSVNYYWHDGFRN